MRGRTPYELWRYNRDAFELYQSRQGTRRRSRFRSALHWASFVGNLRNGHGGNVELKNRPLSDYWVSVLEVFGTNLGPREISERESLWKDKLQSREMGLNRN